MNSGALLRSPLNAIDALIALGTGGAGMVPSTIAGAVPLHAFGYE